MKTRLITITLALALAGLCGCTTKKGPQLPPPIPVELEQIK